MKFLKDLAEFAVADVAVLFVCCVIVFSGSMTAGVIERYQLFGIIPFELVIACVVLMFLMIFSATMMAYEDFDEFRRAKK